MLSQRAHTSLSLSLSLSVRQLGSASGTAEEQRSQLNTDIMLLASLILHESTAEITAQILSLSYVCLISSDELMTAQFIRIFVQINILERRAGYAVLLGRVSVTISYSSRCLTTETVKYQLKQFY